MVTVPASISYALRHDRTMRLRHEIAHAELMHPDEIPRFKKLNAVAELSPILWYPSPLVETMAAVIGRERIDRFCPIKSLLDAGVQMVYGSDWSSVVRRRVRGPASRQS